jgi:large subunit ribosomal protein L9
MKVILKTDVKNLGQTGEVISVKDGYARNFLIPKNLAVEANIKNVKALEHEKRKIEEASKKIKSSAENLSSRLSEMILVMKAKAGEEEKLFGSITAMDIAEELKNQGIGIDKKKIQLDEPIKRLGAYSVNIKIHQNISAKLNVNVVAE